jgi:hypothetical protein
MNSYVPPALTGLLNMSTMMTPTTNMSATMSSDQLPSYQAGGMIGPGGEPVRPNIPGLPGLSGPSQGGLGPQQMELEARRFVQQNPQQVAEIRTAVEEALAEGDITMDQVQLLTNMAKVALQNPEMYPALKQSIVSRGILEDDELPPEFDQGTMFILLLIGQIMQAPATAPGVATGGGAGAAAPSGSAPGSAQPMMSMKKGGPIPMKEEMDDDMEEEDDDMEEGGGMGGKHRMGRKMGNDGGVVILAHEGEYVIPADIVRAKGTEFFDKLIQSYKKTEK